MRFQGSTWALVTRFDDVEEVLTRPNVFDVTYAPKIATIMDGDNIFLGMKDEDSCTRDKTNMRMTAPRGEAMARISPETARLTAAVIDRGAAGGPARPGDGADARTSPRASSATISARPGAT